MRVEPQADQARTVALAWAGPVPLREVAASVPPPEAQAAGVYIWTARVDGEWWAYYVGLTSKTFAERHREHLHLYHEGQYRIYEPEPFAQGRKVLAWGGAFGPQNRHRLPEFRSRHADLAPALEAFLSLLHVFMIPASETRPRERLEAALASILKRAPGGAGWFQDEGIRYAPCHATEEPLTFTLQQPLPIAGLSDRGVIRLPLGIGQ